MEDKDKRALVFSVVAGLLLVSLGVMLFKFLTGEEESVGDTPVRVVEALSNEDKESAQVFVEDYLTTMSEWGAPENYTLDTNIETVWVSGKLKYLENMDKYYSPEGKFYREPLEIANVDDRMLQAEYNRFELLDSSVTVQDDARLITLDGVDTPIATVNVSTVHRHSFLAYPSDAEGGAPEFNVLSADYRQEFTIELVKGNKDSWVIYDIKDRAYPFFFTDFFNDFDERLISTARGSADYVVFKSLTS